MIIAFSLIYGIGVFGFFVAGFINYSFWKDIGDQEDKERARFFLTGAFVWPVAFLQKFVEIIWELNDDE